MSKEPEIRVSEQRPDGTYVRKGRGGGGYVRPPLQPGNELRLTHGAYLPRLSSKPEVIEAAQQLLALAPIATPADGPVATLAAVSLDRVRRALQHVEQLEAEGGEVPERLASDLRGWVRESARLCDQLGLSPSARARLGLHVVRSQSELHDYLHRKLAGDGEVVVEVETDARQVAGDPARTPGQTDAGQVPGRPTASTLEGRRRRSNPDAGQGDAGSEGDR